VLIFILL